MQWWNGSESSRPRSLSQMCICNSRVRSLTPASRDDLVDIVDSIDCRNDSAQEEQAEWLEQDAKPWIALGKDRTKHYGLVLGAYCLIAHNSDYSTPREAL